MSSRKGKEDSWWVCYSRYTLGFERLRNVAIPINKGRYLNTSFPQTVNQLNHIGRRFQMFFQYPYKRRLSVKKFYQTEGKILMG